MPGRKTVGVAGFPSFHRCWARPQFLEQGRIPAFILDAIALEDDPSLELSVRITRWQFTALLDANVEYHAHMRLRSGFASLFSDIRPFSYATFIPASGLSELVPLLLKGLLGGGAGADLGLSNGPCNHRGKGELTLWDDVTMSLRLWGRGHFNAVKFTGVQRGATPIVEGGVLKST